MSELDELERLAQLHKSGVLTDGEFAELKRKHLLVPQSISRSNHGRLVVGIVLLATLVGAVAFVLGLQSRPTTFASHEVSDEPASPVSPVVTPPPKQRVSGLGAIFQRDMIGAQVTYLETFTGPARDVAGPSRVYVVDSCEISATIVDNRVQALGIPTLSPRCTVSLKPFGFDGPLPHLGTFGEFQKIGYETRYTADCLRSCGNAADPVVYATVQTPHANGFIGFRVGAAQVSSQALDAAGKWEDGMLADHGEDWVIDAKFNCTDRYDPIATRLFKNVRISSLEVGSFDTSTTCP